MKKSILTLIGSVLLLASCLSATAQDGAMELQAFQQAAGDRSVLFRGKAAEPYTVQAEGHPYWYGDNYLPGDIVIEDRLYQGLPILIDACAHRALVQLSSGIFSVSLSPAEVQSIRLDGKHFAGSLLQEGLPEGFYEVIGDGPEQVWKRVDKFLTTVNETTRIYQYYSTRLSWYFRDAQGHFTRIRDRGGLLRQFPPERRRFIRQEIKRMKADRSDIPFETWCQAALNAAAL